MQGISEASEIPGIPADVCLDWHAEEWIASWIDGEPPPLPLMLLVSVGIEYNS